MRNLKFLFSLFFVLAFLTQCIDVVQVKLDEGSELIVIDAFLESHYDIQGIYIHKNSTYFNTQKPEPVLNAKVTLYDLTGNKSYKCYYAREDRYELSAEKETFVVGHQYKLEVIVDGFAYSALCTQPRGATIDSISAVPFIKDQFTGESQPLYYMCYLWAKDKADDTPDYYWIKSSRDSAFMNLCIDGTGGIVKNAGQDSIYFSPPYNLFNYYSYSPGSLVEAQVNAITRGTYDFLLQAQAQINNGGMFATTPENVKTNFITPSDAKIKAVGWFSIATVSRGFKEIPG